jgi:hypothetical protein
LGIEPLCTFKSDTGHGESATIGDRKDSRNQLVSCNRSPQHNSYVIPGTLAAASVTRNPGISKRLDTGFRRYDAKETKDLFDELLRHHTSIT